MRRLSAKEQGAISDMELRVLAAMLPFGVVGVILARVFHNEIVGGVFLLASFAAGLAMMARSLGAPPARGAPTAGRPVADAANAENRPLAAQPERPKSVDALHDV